MLVRLAFLALLAATTPLALAQDDEKSSPGSKKVLVELYTSQGCNSCPPANVFLGELARLGYGADKIVPISFHVDYFNTPWVDPFSNADFSRREMAYNSVLKRNDLYFTPMMMVDGRTPMLGSNRPEALKAIKRWRAEKAGVSLKLTATGESADRGVTVAVRPLNGEVPGRALMVGLAVTEGPITTKVPSGENAGSSLVEPFIARSFTFQKVTLDPAKARTLQFPIKLPTDAVAANCRLAVFVQDWDDGRVYQAESIPLAPAAATARR